MVRSRCWFLLWIASLCTFTAAQKPRTAEEALAKFEAVASGPEGGRFRALKDLGGFADELVDAKLLAELRRAEGAAYLAAVVRAIGAAERRGAVPPLVDLLRSRDNPRLLETIATAIAAQGVPGATALIEELDAAGQARDRRSALCEALGRAGGDPARQALLREVQRSGGRDRLPALRALASHHGDAEVEAMRRQLAGDRDAVVAAVAVEQLAEHGADGVGEAAFALLQRLPPDAGSDSYRAALLGLLAAPPRERLDGVLLAAARAEDPFGAKLEPAWRRALDDEPLRAFCLRAVREQKDPEQRVVAARALTLVPDAERGGAAVALMAALGDREADVVMAALAGVLLLAEPLRARSAIETVLQRSDKAADELLPAALAALAALRSGDPSFAEELLGFCQHKRPAARAAALRLCGSLMPVPAAAFAVARENLAHKDWSVRAAAIELLVATRAREVPPELFGRLDREQGRLRQDLVDALRELTGLQFQKVADWQAWWQKEGATFVPRPAGKAGDKPAPRAEATVATYWDIPVTSDRVTFVIDVSGSMRQPFGTGDATRLDEAKRQLLQVLDRLPKQCRANVIPFSFDAEPLFDRLQTIDKKRRKDAEAAVQGLIAKGPTNVHDGLRRAFDDPEIDTIFLLTDGRPSSGPIVAPEALLAEVERWNVGRGVRIHTIGIGERSAFLERLAAMSGGEHSTAR